MKRDVMEAQPGEQALFEMLDGERCIGVGLERALALWSRIQNFTLRVGREHHQIRVLTLPCDCFAVTLDEGLADVTPCPWHLERLAA